MYRNLGPFLQVRNMKLVYTALLKHIHTFGHTLAYARTTNSFPRRTPAYAERYNLYSKSIRIINIGLQNMTIYITFTTINLRSTGILFKLAFGSTTDNYLPFNTGVSIKGIKISSFCHFNAINLSQKNVFFSFKNINKEVLPLQRLSIE